MNTSPIDEPLLIARLKAGQVDAFRQIYNLYSDPIYSYALQITKNTDTAQDIVQEVFMRLWENRRSLLHTHPLRPYLFGIARNSLISAYRKVVNSALYEEYLRQNHADTGGAQAPGPDSMLTLKELQARISHIIQSLPPSQQAVVRLRFDHNLTNTEIARQLDLSEQTVKNRLVMAMKTIRQHLNTAIAIATTITSLLQPTL